jgi:hypothetical protein
MFGLVAARLALMRVAPPLQQAPSSSSSTTASIGWRKKSQQRAQQARALRGLGRARSGGTAQCEILCALGYPEKPRPSLA